MNRIVANRHSVIATADEEPETWHFTTEQPAGAWQDPGFDHSSWKRGRASFGTRGTPNAAVNSIWNTSEIWLRKTFDLQDPETVLGATLRFYHDEDVQIFLNGRKLVQRRGYVTDYLEQPLSVAELRVLLDKLGLSARDLLRTGEDEYRARGLSDPGLSEASLLNAIAAAPILMQRPVLETDQRAAIGRPPENVLDLIE